MPIGPLRIFSLIPSAPPASLTLLYISPADDPGRAWRDRILGQYGGLVGAIPAYGD